MPGNLLRRVPQIFFFDSYKHCNTHLSSVAWYSFSQSQIQFLAKAAVAPFVFCSLAIVSASWTTSIIPIELPVDKQPYGIILQDKGSFWVNDQSGRRLIKASLIHSGYPFIWEWESLALIERLKETRKWTILVSIRWRNYRVISTPPSPNPPPPWKGC